MDRPPTLSYFKFQASRRTIRCLIFLNHHNHLAVPVKVEIGIFRDEIRDGQVLPQDAALLITPLGNALLNAVCHDLLVTWAEPVLQRDHFATLQIDIVVEFTMIRREPALILRNDK